MATFTSIWNEVVALLGIKVTEQGKQGHIDYLRAITAHVQQFYPHLPAEEIRLAYQLGVIGEYGDFDMIVSLAPVQIGKVLKRYQQYLRDEFKPDTLTRVQTDTSKLLADGGPSQKVLDDAWFRHELNRAYTIRQSGQTYDVTGNPLYNQLDDRGLIPFTRERKWEFMRQAQQQLHVEKQREVITSDSLKRNAARTVVETLKTAIEKGQLLSSRDGSIEERAKRLALNQLLSDLIEQGVTVEEFLETNQTNE